MKKRILSILTALCLCLTLLPTAVLAEGESTSSATHASHCVCGATHTNVGDHTAEINNITWEAVSTLEDLNKTSADIYYLYLTGNVTLSSQWKIDSGVNIVLCLNGNKLTADNANVSDTILISGTLTITDCSAAAAGTITGTNNNSGANMKAIQVASGGTLNLYAGSITGINVGKGSGGGVHNKGTFNMYGGSITNNKAAKGGGVLNWPNSGTATFNMYGGTIENNTATSEYGGGVCIEGSGTSTFNMYGGTIKGNKTTVGHGGGVYIAGSSSFNMSGGTITGNTASGTSKAGGGVFNIGGTFTMTGGTIENNTASQTAGNDVHNWDGGKMNANGGTIGGNVYNQHGTITTTDDATSTTFNGAVANGDILKGSGRDGTISGGNYNGTVTNTSKGEIKGGSYSSTVTNNGTVSNGTFSGEVTNNATISGGSYSNTVTNESGSTVTGTVTNNGTFVFETGSDNSTATIEGDGYVEKDGAVTSNNNETLSGEVTVDTVGKLIGAVNAPDVTAIKLGANITLTSTLVIPTGKTLTLELNSKTLSMTDSSNAACYMIKNYGNLTIQDSGTGGKITFQSTTPSDIYAYSASTIGNGGILTVKSGTVENTTASGSSYTIDTISYNADTGINIEGGTISCSAETAIRQIPWSTTYNNTLNISGGSITGNYAAVQTHDFIEIGGLATVNITGGTLTGIYSYFTYYTHTANKDSGDIIRDGRTSHSGTSITITGGTFNGEVYIFNHTAGSSDTLFKKVEISGGTFNSSDDDDHASFYIYTWNNNNTEHCVQAITGGTFASEPYDGYVAEGYIVRVNAGDNTTYTVVANSGLTSGTYTSDPTGSLASGYYAVDNDDGTWTVRAYSSGGSSTPIYAVTVPTAANGTVTVSPKNASKGTTVTVTVTPDSGYTLETLNVTDKNGNALELTDKGNGRYTFKMPAGKVEVKATFMDDNSMLNFFVDVPADAYYYDAVLWAAKNGITGGIDENHFGPDLSCTRAQLLTFLWRAAGCPVVDYAMDFTDVGDGYYTEAVRWAASLGIVGGYGNGQFGTGDTITREQFVTILYRFAVAMGIDVSVGEDTNILSYNDVSQVSEYAVEAMQWAVGADIVQGNDGNLMPGQPCTRAQIVTMLYRLLGN